MQIVYRFVEGRHCDPAASGRRPVLRSGRSLEIGWSLSSQRLKIFADEIGHNKTFSLSAGASRPMAVVALPHPELPLGIDVR
jgi:hypothetical protein